MFSDDLNLPYLTRYATPHRANIPNITSINIEYQSCSVNIIHNKVLI